MKILLVSHRLPFPPDRGGRIRQYQILRHLGRDHDVTLASPLRTDDVAAHVDALRPFARRLILAPVSELRSWLQATLALPTATPSSFAYFHSAQLARSVRCELSDGYDVVLVHCSAMAPYVAPTGAVTIADIVDVDSEKWLEYGRQRRFPESFGFWLEGRKVRRAEAAIVSRFDLCTCATPEELEVLPASGEVGWFRNGVDAEYFRPSSEPADPGSICFIGHMDYYPNRDAMLWFCETVWPQLRAEHPGATLSIIGADPTADIRRLGERPGIRVTGHVADVRPYLWRSALSVAPLRVARGTQNKILESLAMGVPVVASPLAARGTDTIAGEHLLVASEPRDVVAAISRLLSDPGERQRLAVAGRQRMLTHHDWHNSMRRLDALIDGCLARRNR